MTGEDRLRPRQQAATIAHGIPYANAESTLSLLPGAAVGEFLADHRALLTGRLLDAGAGNQPYRDWYAPLVEQAITVDAAPITGLNARGMVDALPFASATFDTVLATEVLEHVDESEKAVAELHRVLRPGGHLLASVPYLYPTHEPPYDFRRFTHYGLARLMQRHGFVDVEVSAKGGAGTWVAHFAVLAATAGAQLLGRSGSNGARSSGPTMIRNAIAAPQRVYLRRRRVSRPVTGTATRISLGYMVAATKPGDRHAVFVPAEQR